MAVTVAGENEFIHLGTLKKIVDKVLHTFL